MKLPALLSGLLVIATAALAEDVVTLPGTQPLTWTGDLSAKMHEAALHDMDKRIEDAAVQRVKFWLQHSPISDSVRADFRKLLNVPPTKDPVRMERFGDDVNPATLDESERPGLVAETPHYRVWQVRWPAAEGIHGEGLLLVPREKPRAYVIAVPDADQTPEQICGLAEGVPADSQFARCLAENGFGVIVPVLIDRSNSGSNTPWVATKTNEPNREWIYRQAFMMGEHIVGYEVGKVLAAVKWASAQGLPVGVAGYGEGGLVALYSAASVGQGGELIKATMVSGYFKQRDQTWQEPLYRNVWGVLKEFGDAEIAALIAPRGLVVEYSNEPAVNGPPPPAEGMKNCAAPGRLTTPTYGDVMSEFVRIDPLVPDAKQTYKLVTGGGKQPVKRLGTGLMELSKMLGTPQETIMQISDEMPHDLRKGFDPAARQLRQVKELEAHVQGLVRHSGWVRDHLWLAQLLPEYQTEAWTLALRFEPFAPERPLPTIEKMRDTFWRDVIGKIDDPLPPPNPRTRKIYDEPKWTGYEVVVDVGGEGFAWGILCVPKDLKPGERRPVVVCQHGRHGMPQDTIAGDKPAYRNFAARLAEQGFITFAPHNLYQKEEYYRTLSRKGNTIGLSMFSVIIRHHQQWLNWLGSLPFVDAKRIGFYGLSYGGESAVRIPTVLEGYCLSICSGDFNDWPRKVASTDDKHSFMFTDEWEMPYFNMGNTFSYAELTYLMFPRPFMAERGHHDQVAPDDWVASEYAKTRYFYDQFGLGDRTAGEFFNGGHTINGQGTFEFLHKHLNWPEEKK